MTKTLALFDLDHTLLPIDSDYEWGQFLVRIGAVDKDRFEKRNAEFFAQYQAGTLDAAEYLAFALGTLAQFPRPRLNRWRQQYMDEVISPAIRSSARNLIENHLKNNDLVAIVTATNKFVTEPIAKAFGVDHLIAALLEETDSGEFTGGLIGAPTSGEGKIAHTENWLRQMNLSFDSFDDTYFYSDSDRDLPLLSKVNHPVAVNPNSRLTEYARTQGWPLMHLFHD